LITCEVAAASWIQLSLSVAMLHFVITMSVICAKLKLPRFRGHPKTGVSDAEEATATVAIPT
jgi:hypothetical protein